MRVSMIRNLLLLILILNFSSRDGFSQNNLPPYPREYVCYHIDHPIVLDGKLDDAVWANTPWTDYFMDIEGPEHTAPRYKTRVKMLWSDSFLYVAAYMQEPHIWAYLTEDEMIMYHDNDFEIFIDPNGDNHNYYEFEFNALNKKWDLFLERPYRDGVEADLKWNCKGLRNATQLYGSINNPKGAEDSAWTMEIAIPLHCISDQVADGRQWRINFSRVEWDTKIRGKKYIKLKKPENNWVWSPQWAINMHRPEYWGYVQFSKYAPGSKDINPRKDPLWNIKMALMNTYYFEREYFNKHGKYTEQLPDDNGQNIHVDTLGNHFVASYHADWGQMNVNEPGRLWRTRMYATPRFWIWAHPRTDFSIAQWDSTFALLHDMGIQGVLMGANEEVMRRCIPVAEKYNIRIHAWIWAINQRQAPAELMSVNAQGKSLAEQKAYVDYYKFVCPILPESRQLIRKHIALTERIDGLWGIHLDYIRYVDVFLPPHIQRNYHLKQDSILPQYDYGYHPAMIKAFEAQYGKSPYDIPNYAYDSLWQQFRMNQINEIVDSLAEDFWSKELKLSAAVFPDPEMARKMVRQDWGRWKIDYYFPMVYNGFYDAGTFWIEQRIKTARKYHSDAKIFCGLFLPHTATQAQLNESMEAAFAGGADGIAFFDLNALNGKQKAAIKKAALKYGKWIK
jgi:hypothetical protein